MKKLGFLALIIYTLIPIGKDEYNLYPLLVAGFILLYDYIKTRKITIGNKKIFITYMAILIAGYIFNLFSESGVKGGEYFLILNTMFFFNFIFINFVDSNKRLEIFRDVFVIGGIILGGVSIAQYAAVYISKGYSAEAVMGFRTGGFTNIFYTGVSLAIASTILTAKLYVEKIKWRTAKEKAISIFWIISFIIFEGMLMTKLRAGIYSYILGFFLILLYNFKLKKALIFLTVLFTVYFSNPQHVRKYSEVVTIQPEKEGLRKDSDNLRRIMWKGAYWNWKKSPFIGVGNDIEIVKEKMADYSREIEDEDGYIGHNIKGDFFREKFSESHSMYLNILMQNGLLILGFLFLFFYILPEQFYKNYKEIKNISFMKNINKVLENQKIKNDFSESDTELLDSVNIGAMVGIINLLLVGFTWDFWHWGFQVQELFQIMAMFLLVVSMRVKDKK